MCTEESSSTGILLSEEYIHIPMYSVLAQITYADTSKMNVSKSKRQLMQ